MAIDQPTEVGKPIGLTSLFCQGWSEAKEATPRLVETPDLGSCSSRSLVQQRQTTPHGLFGMAVGRGLLRQTTTRADRRNVRASARPRYLADLVRRRARNDLRRNDPQGAKFSAFPGAVLVILQRAWFVATLTKVIVSPCLS
jgi:hypothetical protein